MDPSAEADVGGPTPPKRKNALLTGLIFFLAFIVSPFAASTAAVLFGFVDDSVTWAVVAFVACAGVGALLAWVWHRRLRNPQWTQAWFATTLGMVVLVITPAIWALIWLFAVLARQGTK